MNKKEIKLLLEKEGLAPLKRLGQNFLIDKDIIQKIVDLVDEGETVVEVGPGLGALTIPTAKKSKQLIAFEKDIKIAALLERLDPSITVIKKDILDAVIALDSDYLLLSNLPFYITSAVIRKFLEEPRPPKKMVLVMQKEVAQRICASPPNMNLLALSVQFYAEPKILFKISKNSFWPTPRVDSALLVIEGRVEREVSSKDFFRVVKAGFSHPRAQLLNNLSKKIELDKEKLREMMLSLEIDPRRRAESLSINEWLSLAKKINQ